MKIQFADTFSESLKMLRWHQSKIYKFYSFFRYDIWRFLKNIWRFRKGLYNYYWWDHHGTLMFFEIGINHMSKNIEEKGLEIDISRMKKVQAMKRVVEIIKNYNEDNYIEMAESELGELYLHDWKFEEVPDKPGFSRLVEDDTPEEKKHNRKVFNRARQIEKQEWDELFKLLKGQDIKDYKKFEKTLTEEQKKSENQYYEWFDGSGLKGWWD